MANAKKLRVLFVDDEPSMLKIVGKHLELAGFELVTAINGEEGLLGDAAPDPILPNEAAA